MNLFTLAPDAVFLDAVAARWLAGGDVLARGMILLPTRRAARSLADAFLRVSGGRPLLMPRIVALGAIDEAPLALAGALDLPPAVAPALRQAVLARMVLGLPEAAGGARAADRAWRLAGELASLMDEAERAEIDLSTALRDAAGGEYAAHWGVTLEFLEIVTAAWPAWLAANGAMNPAARQVALLHAQARAWTEAPPADPVWVAGTTGGIPAVAALLRVVAGLPRGQVLLPGLDLDMAPDVWDALDEAHPQAGLRALLSGLNATRGDVDRLEAAPSCPPGRAALLAEALLPASAFAQWRTPQAPAALAGLWRLQPADAQEEAVAISLVLREALTAPGALAALVTQDRALAVRVAAELLRWGIVADDSAGEPLAETPPAVLLRLLAQAIADGLAPVALLALLKHPLCGLGLSPPECRAATRALERHCLRGPKPPPGIAGLRVAVAGRRADGQGEAVTDLLTRLEAALEPILRATASVTAAPAATLAALIAAGEALAATDETPGPARLWAAEEGEMLATHLAEALAALAHLPDEPPANLGPLLDALLEGRMVRTRRALRGRKVAAEHPRVFIWGLLEARLQAVDVVVLGGLAESIWPPATDPGPWMSRPMRARAGLPSPEEIVGQSAHDFMMATCAAPLAVLSCPRRREGAPAVPARWLARLDAYLAGRGLALPLHPAAGWARLLDQPAGKPQPVSPPRPCPDVGLRPQRLSVTEIETWLADPYAIYARHILRLRPLDPLEQATDAADYGTLVHRGLQIFFAEHGARWPADAEARLRTAMLRALQEAGLRSALAEWWAPRLLRIADWVAAQEIARRCKAAPVALVTEAAGNWHLASGFELRGRADRLERRGDGSLAILDYKTGVPPTVERVVSGMAPQLPLEAAMAAAAAFGPAYAGPARELTFWHLTGSFHPGQSRSLSAEKTEAAILAAQTRLDALIAAYAQPDRAYLSQPHPDHVPRFSDYAQLARVAEWDLSEEGA